MQETGLHHQLGHGQRYRSRRHPQTPSARARRGCETWRSGPGAAVWDPVPRSRQHYDVSDAAEGVSILAVDVDGSARTRLVANGVGGGIVDGPEFVAGFEIEAVNAFDFFGVVDAIGDVDTTVGDRGL